VAVEDLLTAVRLRGEALAGGRAEQLRALLHPDFRWTSHLGEVFTRDSYVAANTGGALRWRRQTVRAPEAVVVGPVGIVTAVVVDEVERDGAPWSARMPVTQTWLRVDGRWLCLAGHAGHAGPLLP
jgi:Domain of unknown function (DUF4440)